MRHYAVGGPSSGFFVGSSTVEGALWGPRRAERDVAARLAYRSLAEEPMRLDDVFIIDLIRREG